jgi:hypothetical protein
LVEHGLRAGGLLHLFPELLLSFLVALFDLLSQVALHLLCPVARFLLLLLLGDVKFLIAELPEVLELKLFLLVGLVLGLLALDLLFS